MRNSCAMRRRVKSALVILMAAPLLGCADSTIHKTSAVGDVQTLSLDAKQRLVLVASRSNGHSERITCTEPMPDALVARAAVLAASGSFQQTGGPTASGGISGGQTETAGSIGFRDHTIQMLRDGYFRLCEAYLNGAMSAEEYSAMIRNADTFMVVVSALQVLGSNQAAPAVVLTPGALTATVNKDGQAEVKSTPGTNPDPQKIEGKEASKENAKVAGQIVEKYLRYRAALARFEAENRARLVALERAKSRR